MTGEIKACPNPWCKSHDRSDDEIFKAHRPILTASRSSFERAVACPVCPIQTPWFATEAEAIAAWEDRASDACATVQRERDEAREEVDRLRSVLKSHPGWHADVTFAAIWKWLALKDEALGEDHETARYEASK